MKKTALARKTALDILDPVEIDPGHFSVEHENNEVRVLRIKMEPSGKFAMHDHSDGVAVFLTDARARFTYPDGKTDKFNAAAREAKYMPSGRMMVENLAANPIELIFVELKR